MKIENINLSKLKKEILYFAEAIFTSSLIGYLMLFLFESIKEGFVSNYFNMNIFLWVCFASGAVLVLIKEDAKPQKTKITARDYVFILFIGICGGLIIWLKTKEMGYVSYLIGVISGILIICLSILLLSENKEKIKY